MVPIAAVGVPPVTVKALASCKGNDKPTTADNEYTPAAALAGIVMVPVALVPLCATTLLTCNTLVPELNTNMVLLVKAVRLPVMVTFKVVPAAAVLGETEVNDWALTVNPMIKNKYVNRFFIIVY
jgi:hypothetical protein